MFSVYKIALAIFFSLFFLSIIIVLIRYYLTSQKPSKESNNDHEEFQLIPFDLVVEIFKKLPSKSLMRFRCVSKQFSTIISNRRDFIDSIITRPFAQNLPVFIFHHRGPETFITISSTLSQTTKPKVTLISRPSYFYSFNYQYLRGFIFCSSTVHELVMIYNPTTRQCIRLPDVKPTKKTYYHFGYDPVMNQYKVLAFNYHPLTIHVFTLDKDCYQWRQIQSNIDEIFFPTRDPGVCVDGTIYYAAINVKGRFYYGEKGRENVLFGFNVKSETFCIVQAPEALLESLSCHNQSFFNYLGKLGCISCNKDNTSVWIMENAEKQEWSKITFGYKGGDFRGSSGVTPGGEIYVVKCLDNKPFYVCYYDIKQNSFREVEIEGSRLETTEERGYNIRVFAIHDHVENTMWL